MIGGSYENWQCWSQVCENNYLEATLWALFLDWRQMPWKWIYFLSAQSYPQSKRQVREISKRVWVGGSDELTEAKFGLLDYLLTNKEWWQVHFASGYSQQRSWVPRVAVKGAAAPLCCLVTVWEARILWQFRQRAGAGLLRWGLTSLGAVQHSKNYLLSSPCISVFI